MSFAANAAAIGDHFGRCLARADRSVSPFEHWLIEDALPPAVCEAVIGLPFAPPRIDDTRGKRETHNSTRIFFSSENRARFPVVEEVASAFQSAETVRRIEQLCRIALAGSSLRIEYCLDTDGFWLEPHTDIGAKLFTMLIYLSEGPYGTDLLDPEGNLVATAPCHVGAGVIFVPGADTWHGFRRRRIEGVRRSLIVNYVKPEWRSRHELAYPEIPVS